MLRCSTPCSIKRVAKLWRSVWEVAFVVISASADFVQKVLYSSDPVYSLFHEHESACLFWKYPDNEDIKPRKHACRMNTLWQK